MITQERLREILNYDPDTGVFTWRINRPSNAMAGDIAGTDLNGYVRISADNNRYQAHRLAWLYVYGRFPKNHIDHINHVRSDNRIANLREVSQKQNCRNSSKSIANTSGVTGVTWSKRDNKWQSQIMVNAKLNNLGAFSDKFEAICARMSANNKHGFHKNHGK